jgi:hypothetical protein
MVNTFNESERQAIQEMMTVCESLTYVETKEIIRKLESIRLYISPSRTVKEANAFEMR